MKKIIVIFLCLLLAGCVTMKYQDGDKSVEYASIGRTAQSIKGDLNNGTVSVEGQKVDAEIGKALTNLVNAVRGL